MLKLSLLEKLTILGVYFRIIRSHAIHCLSWVLDTLESIHQNCCICVRILITSTVRIPVPGYSQSQEENVMYFHRKEPFLLYPVHGVPKGGQKEKKMSGFGAYIFAIGIPRLLIL